MSDETPIIDETVEIPNTPWTREQASAAAKKAWANRKAAQAEAEEQRRREANLPPTPKFLEVLERRLKDPHIYGDGKIELDIPGEWTCRWVNTDIEGRYDLATRYRGWEPVKVHELKDQRQIPAFTPTPDGFVARGVRSAEILMRMPTDYWQKIQREKAERRQSRNTGSRLRQDIAEHVSAFHGRADLADAGMRMKGELKESLERVELDAHDRPPVEAV